jgi:hypothetical protein
MQLEQAKAATRSIGEAVGLISNATTPLDSDANKMLRYAAQNLLAALTHNETLKESE